MQYVPGSVAYAGVIVNAVDANSAVFARIRRAFVEISFTIFPRPSGQTLALVFALGERQTNAVVSARILLTKPYTELRFAENSGVAGLASAAKVSL